MDGIVMESPIAVLYIDDEPDLLEIGKIFLESYRIFTVDTSVSAKDVLDSDCLWRYDAIISDYQMPIIDGIELLKRVRSRYGDLPFILFTGRGREEIVIEAINNGADFYLQKGGNPKAQFAELAHKIRTAVGRKRAERALEESERRYRDVVETQTEFICRFRPGGVLVFVNEAYCRHFNRSREEIIGQRIIPRLPEEDQERMRHHLASLTPEDPAGSIEHRIVMPDDSIRWHWWNDRAFFDDNGRVTEYQSVGKDITDQKQAEEALQLSLERLTLGQRASRSGFWDWDVRTDTFVWSPELFDLFGLPSSAPATLETWLTVIHPDDRERATATIKRSIDERIPLDTEYRILLPDGSERWIGALGDMTYHADRSPVRMSGICIDVTERKQAEEALRESEMQLSAARAVSAERERFFDVLEALPVMICLLTIDHQVAFANRRYREMFGESMGRHCYEMNFGFAEPCPFCEAYSVLETGVPHQWEFITPAGRIIEVFNAPFTDVDGTPLILEMDIDVTAQRQADAAMREANTALANRFRDLFESMAEGFALHEIVLDGAGIPVDYRFLAVNPAFETMTGLSAGEIIGRTAREVIPDLEPAWIERYGRVAQTGEPTRFESFAAPLGRLYDVHAYSPGTGRFVTVITDITDQRHAAESLRESEEKFRSLAEGSSDYIMRYDREGRHLYMNPAALRVAGLTEAEIIGKTHREAGFDESLSTTWEEHIRRVFDTGEEVGIQFAWESVDGLVHLDWKLTPEFGEDGSVRTVLGISRDITEMKRLEARLRLSGERFSRISSITSDFAFSCRGSGGTAYAIEWMAGSVEQITGYAVDELKANRCWRFLVIDEDLPIFDQHILGINPGSSSSCELRITRKDGTCVWLQCHAELVDDPDTPGVRVLYGGCTDISERKRMEHALQGANRQLNLLIGVTRHDIKNQLLVLKGYLQLLRTAGDPEMIATYVQKEEEIADRIEEMILVTKEFENLGASEPVWQDVGATFERVHKRIDAVEVSITAQDVASLEILADPLFEKVLFNLLDNALRHGGEQLAHISLSSRREGDHLLLVFEDDGIGVPVEEKEKIFERGVGRNTGYGLFLIREILAVSGIAIAETGTCGAGARYEISVPHGLYRWKEIAVKD
jgi:PAS domain S-box-containing protein